MANHATAGLARPTRFLRHRSTRFAIVGVGATVFHGLALGILSGPGRLTPMVANTLALIGAAAVSYFGHRSFTFRPTGNHAKSVSRFAAQFAGSWVASSTAAALLIPVLGAWPVAALITVLVPCLNYFIYARWTFR